MVNINAWPASYLTLYEIIFAKYPSVILRLLRKTSRLLRYLGVLRIIVCTKWRFGA